MKSSILSAILLAGIVGLALAGEPRYAGFEVTNRENAEVTFMFSAGDATSASPIIISIPGRKLTNADRVYRVDLQKHWVSLHAPEQAVFVSRSLKECGLERPEEFPYCDVYVFKGPGADKRLEFYIYVGNWP